jgi:hypothetical protein
VNLGQSIGSRITLRANTELIHTLTQRGISGNDNAGVSPYTVFARRRRSSTCAERRRHLPGEPYGTTNRSRTPTSSDAAERLPLIGSVAATYSPTRRAADARRTPRAASTRTPSAARHLAVDVLHGAGLQRALAGTLYNSDANVLTRH